MCAKYTGISRLDAVKLIGEKLNYTPDFELVPLEEATWRIAAKDIVSKVNLPNMKSSRWDGIAFEYDNYQRCNGDVSNWRQGEDYVFSNTGIGIFEEHFDTMVKIETTSFDGEKLMSIDQPQVEKGQFIIPKGERIAKGEVLVKANEKIKPSHLNLMASGGLSNVTVYCRPRVAILPTGNELISNRDIVEPGKTIESNSFSMAAKVRACGGVPFVYPISSDDMPTLQATLKEAAALSDIIIIGGGSGRGRFDLLQDAIEDIGTMYFSDVEHGPGKRTCFSVIDETPVFGLVGPPGGAELTFDFYVVPAIYACLKQDYETRKVMAVLDEDVPPHSRVSFFFTMQVYWKDGEYHGVPLPHSNLDRSIADHNGYVFIRKTSEGYKKGDRVEVELRVFYDRI